MSFPPLRNQPIIQVTSHLITSPFTLTPFPTPKDGLHLRIPPYQSILLCPFRNHSRLPPLTLNPTPNFFRAQITEMKSLRIERLVASDDGVYVCEGKNDVGSVEAAARLTIHSQPSFSAEPIDQTVGAHRSVTFKVREA